MLYSILVFIFQQQKSSIGKSPQAKHNKNYSIIHLLVNLI